MAQSLYSEGIEPGDGLNYPASSFGGSTAGGFTSGSGSSSKKSLGRNVFSRAGKEMFNSLRPLYDERIKRATEYDSLRDQMFRRGLALMGSDNTTANINKVGAHNAETARLMASHGLMGDSSTGSQAGLSQYYLDKAAESTFDYTANQLSPEEQMKKLMASLGLTEQELQGLLDFGAAGQLHGLTQDLNPQSRNTGGGIGGLLGGLAGNALSGVNWGKVFTF